MMLYGIFFLITVSVMHIKICTFFILFLSKIHSCCKAIVPCAVIFTFYQPVLPNASELFFFCHSLFLFFIVDTLVVPIRSVLCLI